MLYCNLLFLSLKSAKQIVILKTDYSHSLKQGVTLNDYSEPMRKTHSFLTNKIISRRRENFTVENYKTPLYGVDINNPKYSFTKSKKHTYFDDLIKLSKSVPGAPEYSTKISWKCKASKFPHSKKISFMIKDALDKKNFPSPSQYKHEKCLKKSKSCSFPFFNSANLKD